MPAQLAGNFSQGAPIGSILNHSATAQPWAYSQNYTYGAQAEFGTSQAARDFWPNSVRELAGSQHTGTTPSGPLFPALTEDLGYNTLAPVQENFHTNRHHFGSGFNALRIAQSNTHNLNFPVRTPEAEIFQEPLSAQSHRMTTTHDGGRLVGKLQLPPFNPRSSIMAHSQGPLDSTEFKFGNQVNHTDILCNGQVVTPTLLSELAKGFLSDDDEPEFHAYRRNYFAVDTAFSLALSDGSIPTGILTISDRDGSMKQIKAFGVLIEAVIEGLNKSIQLIAHTPKRDSGPKRKVDTVRLPPSPVATIGEPPSYTPTHLVAYSSTTPFAGPELPFQNTNSPHLPIDGIACYAQQQNNHVSGAMRYHPGACFSFKFERLQFKNATANNGKRTNLKQKFQLVASVMADIRDHPDGRPEWVKIASKSSDAVMVRGRSPNHYAGGRGRNSNATNSRRTSVQAPRRSTVAYSPRPQPRGHNGFLIDANHVHQHRQSTLRGGRSVSVESMVSETTDEVEDLDTEDSDDSPRNIVDGVGEVNTPPEEFVQASDPQTIGPELIDPQLLHPILMTDHVMVDPPGYAYVPVPGMPFAGRDLLTHQPASDDQPPHWELFADSTGHYPELPGAIQDWPSVPLPDFDPPATQNGWPDDWVDFDPKHDDELA